MDIPTLAAEAVKALAPALPALIFVGTEAAKEVVKKTTDGALVAAKALWEKLRPHAETRPALLEAAQDVAKTPDDTAARGAFEMQLRKLLEAEPQLRSEIEPLVQQVAVQQNVVIVKGDGAVGIGGNVSGVSISTNVGK